MKYAILLLSLAVSLWAATFTTPEVYYFSTAPPPVLCGISPALCDTGAQPINYLLSIVNDGSTFYHFTFTGRDVDGDLQTFTGEVDANDRYATNYYVVTNGALTGIVLDVKGYK